MTSPSPRPEALAESRAANAADVTSSPLESAAGALALYGEDAESPYAVVLETGGVGVYVQTSASNVDPSVLVEVAESIGGG